MTGLAGAMVNIKGNAETMKTVADERVVFVDDRPGGCILFERLIWDGRPMLIAAAHKNDILSIQSQVPGINICGNIGPGQMPDVLWPVGIR